MLCCKLHRQKGFDCIIFSCKMYPERRNVRGGDRGHGGVPPPGDPSFLFLAHPLPLLPLPSFLPSPFALFLSFALSLSPSPTNTISLYLFLSLSVYLVRSLPTHIFISRGVDGGHDGVLPPGEPQSQILNP